MPLQPVGKRDLNSRSGAEGNQIADAEGRGSEEEFPILESGTESDVLILAFDHFEDAVLGGWELGSIGSD